MKEKWFDYKGVEVRLESGESIAWVLNKDNKVVIFPTAGELLEVIQQGNKLLSGSEAHSEWVMQMHDDLNELTEFKNDEDIIVLGLTDEDRDEYITEQLSYLLINWLCYCVTYNLHREELVNKLLDKLVIDIKEVDIDKEKDVYCLDKTAQNKFWLFSWEKLFADEIDNKLLLYNLSNSEREKAIEELNNNDVNCYEKKTFIKGVKSIFNEIRQHGEEELRLLDE